MRLYCPNCRAMYEEPEERFRLQGGRIPCRVCRTELVPQDAPAGFRETGATMVNPPASAAPFLRDDDATVADVKPRPGAPGQGVSGEATTALSGPPGARGGAIMGGAIAGGGSGTRPSEQPARPGPPAITGGAIAGGGSGVSMSMPRPGAPMTGGAMAGGGSGVRSSEPVKTTVLDPAASGHGGYGAPPPAPHGQASPYGSSPYGAPPGSSPPSPYASPSPYGAPSPYGPPSPYGAPPSRQTGPPPSSSSTPYLQPDGPPGPPPAPSRQGGFHQDPTFIFETPRPSNPPPPMSPPPGHAPPPGPDPQRPSGDPKKPRRQVVIGGAAGVGSAGEALKTQAFDVKIIEDKTFEAMRSQKMVLPPGGIEAAAGAPAPRPPMIVGGAPVMGADEVTSQELMVRRRRWPIVLLLLVVVAAIALGVMALLGVFSSGGSSGGDATTTATTAGAAPTTPLRADRLLNRLRARLEPATVTSGGPTNTPGFAVGVSADDAGQVGYWLSTGDAPVSLPDPNAVIAALPQTGVPVFVLFDRRIPPESAARFLDALRAAGHTPSLAAGSPMGEDVYFAFPADGADSASFRIQLGTRAIVVHAGGDAAPAPFCYSGVVPSDQVTRLSDQALTGVVDPQIALEAASGVALQQVLYLVQATYRPGLHLRLLHSPTDFTGPGCGP